MVRGEVGCQAGMRYVWVFVSLGDRLDDEENSCSCIRWKITIMLEDFADDLALISSTKHTD